MGTAHLHRGDSASYRYEGGALGCHAGLGVRPVEVYMPPEELFDAQVPRARGRHAEMKRAFEALGARVVILANATVWTQGDPLAPG